MGDLSTPHTARLGGQCADRTHGACLLEGISPTERLDVSADRRPKCRGRSGGGGFGTSIGTGNRQESAGMPEAALRVVCHRHLSLK